MVRPRVTSACTGTALVALVLLFAACTVRSLDPLYYDDDTFFEPALLGRWQDPSAKQSDGDVLEFTRPDPSKPNVLFTVYDKGKPPLQVDARLVRLAGRLFADFRPVDDPHRHFFTVDAHLIERVRIDGDKLHLGAIRSDKAALAQRGFAFQLLPDPGANHTSKQPAPRTTCCLLTGTTAELRALFTRHGGDDELFSESTYVRSR